MHSKPSLLKNTNLINFFTTTRRYFLSTILCGLLVGHASIAFAASSSINGLDAAERGLVKSEGAKGTLTPTYESSSGKDVLDLSYSLSNGTPIKIWFRNFPASLNAATSKLIKIGINTPSAEQASHITASVAIVGNQDVQMVPIDLKSGWSWTEAAIEWNRIGDLSEIDLVVKPSNETDVVHGTLYLALEFPASAVPEEAAQPAAEVVAPAEEAVGAAEEPVVLREEVIPAESEIEEVLAPVMPEPPAAKQVPKSSYTIMDSGERSILKEADGKGTLTPTFDAASDKDIIELGYDLKQQSSVIVVIKKFPSELNTSSINTARIGIRVLDPEQLSQISTQVEIKGTKDSIILPINLKSGWNFAQTSLDRNAIGDLNEVAFAVHAIGSDQSAHGSLYLALDLITLAPKEKIIPEKVSSFTLLDAGEKGVFNIGDSQGTAKTYFDPGAEKEVWQFDYSLPLSSVVGVWSKGFPSDLGKKAADALSIGVNVPTSEQLREISVKLEIKGKSGAQSIPLRLKQGRSITREHINWNTIGELSEVVFVVSPMAANPIWFNPTKATPAQEIKPFTGTLYFDLEFRRLTLFQRNFTAIKFGLVFAFASLLYFLLIVLYRSFGFRRKTAGASGSELFSEIEPVFLRLKSDFFYGVMTVLIIGVTMMIYAAGMKGILDTDFNLQFIGLAFAGAIIAELLKVVFVGRHLTPREIFHNTLVAGFLAVASSKSEILQAPANLSQILLFNNLIASVTFLIYCTANAVSLRVNGKHLRGISTALIVGTPYLFNWLLLVESANLLQIAMSAITGGVLAAWPLFLQSVGRVIVIFGFNQAIINGIKLSLEGKFVKSQKSHLQILLVSLGLSVAPLLADLGSGAFVAGLPVFLRAIASALAAMVSFAGLWGEVYLITGISLDAGHRRAPSEESIERHILAGTKKGVVYSGILVALIYAISMLFGSSIVQHAISSTPVIIGTLAGALLFPLLKTIIESFDGSLPFFERLQFSYQNRTSYFRGAVAGFGFAFLFATGIYQQTTPHRCLFGLIIGVLASGIMSILRDTTYQIRGVGRVQSWKLYAVDSLLGAFVGTAIAFYLDALQVPVVIEKFKLYTSVGFAPVNYTTYPLLNKWGRIDLGDYTGGAKLLFIESLAGVINWSIAAWLFAINKVFMQAYFDKDKTPIKFFFSKEGFSALIEHMIYVLRWGLWMSPIIFTFLRMMPEPTWYNQDGAIRTLFAIFHQATMTPDAFREWSLKIFVYILAFDFFRILIWMDHMGLRVATLVNLSFLGLDKLDEKVARFIGPAVAQRYIPEAVKRFATWAPLLIPFYLPRGEAWDYAWGTAAAVQNAGQDKGIIVFLQTLTTIQMVLVIGLAIMACSTISFLARYLRRQAHARQIKSYELRNRNYRVVLRENGESYSEVEHKKSDVYPREFDVTRRSYDIIDPCGRALFLMDISEAGTGKNVFWPVLGNYPKEHFNPSRVSREDDTLRSVNEAHGIRSTIEIDLMDQDTTAEIWTVTLENLTGKARKLKAVSYLEWVLNGGLHDRFHTQYARLFPEMEYVGKANAILAWHKGTKSMGILAADSGVEGFATNRMDFIGRARSLWNPRMLETLNFLEARDTAAYPTFDPIGSLAVGVQLDPHASKTIRLMVGYAKDRKKALDLVQKLLKPVAPDSASIPSTKKKQPLIGHGEIPFGTPQPYSEYVENGNKLVVHTPYTPRPFDHALSNEVHSVMVTNRGLHTSCNGNSQQNRITPDWPDTVTKEVPAEAIYLYDIDKKEWFSPTYHPLNDRTASHKSEFSVNGTAVFHMTQGTLSTELTVFVPPKDPLGVYLLTIRNQSDSVRKMRVAPYFQMALAFQPEKAGPLVTKCDREQSALFFENPRNLFRSGWAFSSMSIFADQIETKRGRFVGSACNVARPFMVANGVPDTNHLPDDKAIASFIGTLDIPAKGERTVAIILGQTDTRDDAVRLVQKYKSVEMAQKSLEMTREWWKNLMSTVVVETNQPDFDRYQNWLKYQALAERIWARRGFYQTSGAFGFRDQLQDTVNLIWVDPALARKQIILHASHQFTEGDVFHWFFTLPDGRTAFSCRSHASDNPAWLSWGVMEYVKATGDESILDELASYVISEFPFAPLPKNKHGWGHNYHRATRSDSIYRHAMKSIELLLEKRIGKHGLPLMGTGDWNDGLDEIGSEGRGESVWLGFFLHYILKGMLPIIEKREGHARKDYYIKRLKSLETALEKTWRQDRYLRAFHDDGTEIGLKDSGVWEIDALTAAWAVMSGINFERGLAVFNTALEVLEKEKTILLGWPALREDTKPYLGRSSKYPEGVRENGMYSHGVQWLVKAARLLAEQFEARGDALKASEYRGIAYRLWLKISPIPHVEGSEIEIYGGQPNKQAADLLTTFDQGRMIWSGYTGAAGWMLRQAIEGVVGATLIKGDVVLPKDLNEPRGKLTVKRIQRNVDKSSLHSTEPHSSFSGNGASMPDHNKAGFPRVKLPAASK